MTDFSASFVARSLPALLDGAHVRASNGTDTGLDGTLSTVSSNVPAFDRDQGVVLGAGATQSIYNTGFSGAVAGSPGTAPTGWSAAGTGGTLAVESSAFSGANRLRFSASSARQYLAQTVPALSSGVTYCFSCALTVYVPATFIDLFHVATGSVAPTITARRIDGVSATDSTTVTAGEHTLELLFTVPSAGSVSARMGVGTVDVVTADAVFDLPQLEAGSFRTSYIYNTSTSAALLREPSYISSTLAALGLASQVNEYTIAVAVRPAFPSTVVVDSVQSMMIAGIGQASFGLQQLRIEFGVVPGRVQAWMYDGAAEYSAQVNGLTWSPGDVLNLRMSKSAAHGIVFVAGSTVAVNGSAGAKADFSSALNVCSVGARTENIVPISYLCGVVAGALFADRAYSQAELEALDATMFDPVVTLDGITYPATVTGSNQVSITVAGIGEFDAAGDHVATPWYENVPVTLAIGDESASSTLQVVAPVPGNFGTAGASPVYPPVGLDIGDDVYVDKVSGAGTADPEGVDYSAATSSVVRFRAFNQNSALWLAYREESFAVGGIVMAIVRPVVKSVVEAIT